MRGGGSQHGLVLVAVAALGVTSTTCSTWVRRSRIASIESRISAPTMISFRAAVVEDIVDFVPGQPEVDDGRRRTQAGGGQGGLDAGRGDSCPEATTSPRPMPRAKGTRQPTNAIVELRPGEGAAQVGHGLLVPATCAQWARRSSRNRGSGASAIPHRVPPELPLVDEFSQSVDVLSAGITSERPTVADDKTPDGGLASPAS